MRPLAFATGLSLAISPAAAFELSSPIACPADMICPVQNLFDHDPGPGFLDFRCGGLGYDGHDGIDFRLPSMEAQRQGIEVTAAADGIVLGARDGMADVGIAGAGGREQLKGVECGNGVLVDHGDGWRTQYCHMAQGSIEVAKGDRVRRGRVLGKVGLSGLTEFPHLHLSVRKDGGKVDPYAPQGAPAGTCEPGQGLWSADAGSAVGIETPLTLNAGFSDGPVQSADIESGDVAARPPGGNPAALVAYARVIGLETGDALRVTLRGPAGEELATNAVPPADRPKAQWAAFAGRKRPDRGWAAGDYKATVEILRHGTALKSSEVSITLGR